MNREELRVFLDEIQTTQGENFAAEEAKIEAEMFDPAKAKSDRLVRNLSGLGGFITSILFVALLFAFELFENEMVSIVFGAVFFGIAIWANSYFKITVLETAALGLYLSGGFLFVSGLNDLFAGENSRYIISAILILISAITIYFSRSFVMLLFAFLTIVGSIITMTYDSEILFPLVILAFGASYLMIFFNESKLISKSEVYIESFIPLQISLILGMIFYFIFKSVSTLKPEFTPTEELMQTITAVLFMFGSMFVIYRTTQLFKFKNFVFQIALLAATIAAMLPELHFPEITGSIFLILTSFYFGHKTGIALSILSFIFVMTVFYYVLDYTLIQKSYILLATGAVMVGAYFGLQILYQKNKI